MLLTCDLAFANNLSLSNVSLTSQSATASTVKVQFDISWSNAWRNNTNYDAAWIFIKYSTDSGVTWNHATLKTSGTNPSGFSTGSGTSIQIVVPTDKKGAFIQRSANGYGSLSTTSVQFVWDYGTDGLSASTSAQVKVFGIEMVYIPTASFYVGDGTTSNVTGQFAAGSGTSAFQITSEGQLTLGGGGGGSLGNNNAAGMYQADDFNNSTSVTLPAAFPKGYAAFYLMKYEITQGQYVEFLNTLTRVQQQTRVETILGDTVTNVYVLSNTSSISYRNTVRCPASGNGTTAPVVFSTTRPDRGCNFLSWLDVAAFLDWAALRPMTELEFEKAARGTKAAVADEYAWGSTSITFAATISGTEDGTETITTSGANINTNNTTFSGGDASQGCLRVGIFATSTSTRVQAGAGYYGNMELSGNVWERVVNVGYSTATSRAFTGTHGDGTLTTTTSYEGNATNTDWPAIDGTTARGVTGSNGSGFRGGSLSDTDISRARISDRKYADLSQTIRHLSYGGRGGRTAP